MAMMDNPEFYKNYDDSLYVHPMNKFLVQQYATPRQDEVTKLLIVEKHGAVASAAGWEV